MKIKKNIYVKDIKLNKLYYLLLLTNNIFFNKNVWQKLNFEK